MFNHGKIFGGDFLPTVVIKALPFYVWNNNVLVLLFPATIKRNKHILSFVCCGLLSVFVWSVYSYLSESILVVAYYTCIIMDDVHNIFTLCLSVVCKSYMNVKLERKFVCPVAAVTKFRLRFYMWERTFFY